MRKERHEEVLREVLDEIDAALKDSRGLAAHQRRLAFILSLGATNVLELFLHKLSVIKEGAQINHLWFKQKKERIIEHLKNQIIGPIDTIDGLLPLIGLIITIEEKRDDLAYGAEAPEAILQEKINLFLRLKGEAKC
ncbi:hypothetical protein HYU14_03810 [Candidatus Woesearchaeota archaeon]|nr:hypothetical protein [Candidatus Woesearchaeota archaeon]